ncbi:hypothetical protein FGO68_gene2754 [Halteria grandinella]|uniref:Uncharacterized protein n=1 Tax=Halteria grandinella TaxID=5974 RepID=A0A8J8NI64_HALGN|nr:hypothetical protein FGO68_gene2754 [Halteria grandinella]
MLQELPFVQRELPEYILPVLLLLLSLVVPFMNEVIINSFSTQIYNSVGYIGLGRQWTFYSIIYVLITVSIGAVYFRNYDADDVFLDFLTFFCTFPYLYYVQPFVSINDILGYLLSLEELKIIAGLAVLYIQAFMFKQDYLVIYATYFYDKPSSFITRDSLDLAYRAKVVQWVLIMIFQLGIAKTEYYQIGYAVNGLISYLVLVEPAYLAQKGFIDWA